jgi:uncharacterized protein YndB with AHSA1/START domain
MPPRRVFDAWLDPGLAGRWLFATASRPMTDVEIDARVGGGFRLADRCNGKTTEHHGQYLEIVPHRRLVFTLRGASRPREATRVIVEIVPRKRGCELRLRHENVPPDRAHDTEARWTGMLYGLGETLASHPGRVGPD